MQNIALVFAGGIGSRMGADIPKQFLKGNDKEILVWTLEAFEKHSEIDGIVLVCKEEWIPLAEKLIAKYRIEKIMAVVSGGETAMDSQYNGLKAIKSLYPQEEITVLIHDGVRPFVDEDTISENIALVHEKGNAITVTNAIETIVGVNGTGKIDNIFQRENCRIAKAPQSFLLDDILNAHEQAKAAGHYSYIDSASMMHDFGYSLNMVEGSTKNIKITTQADYYVFLAIIQAEAEE